VTDVWVAVHEASLTDPVSGDRIDKFVSRTLNAADQTIHVTFMYDSIDGVGRVHRHMAPFNLRYIHRHEMTLLLAAAGFHIVEVHGDYALSPFESDSVHQIIVARPSM
jgi:hypothetical protein